MRQIKHTMLGLMLAGVLLVPAAHAHAATLEDTLKQIQALMAQIEELQKQLNTIRGEVKAVIRTGIAEGMSGEDIAKLQELLATDPNIYPEGKRTGYFGPLTKEALKRFQMRHELRVTGMVDDETRDLLEEYLKEGFGDRIPPGLLRAPGILKKVEMRYELKCESKKGMGPLCKKLKIKYKDEDDDDDSDDDDSDDEVEVEVEVEDGETKVEFKADGKEYDVMVDSTDLSDVLEAVADELDVDVEDLDDTLVKAIKVALAREIDDVREDFEVEVEVENGTTTVSFEFDGEDYEVVVPSTDEDAVLDAAADAIEDGDTEEDLDSDLRDAIEDALEAALDNDDEEAKEDADDAINDAENAIEDAEDAIDDATGDTADAEELLDDAKDKLDEAEEAYDDEDYEDAEDLADEAKELAEDAEDAL